MVTIAAMLALDQRTHASETLWLSAQDRAFSDRSAWSAGVPSAATDAIFGLVPSVTPFSVSVDALFGIKNLIVRSQSPRFVMSDAATSDGTNDRDGGGGASDDQRGLTITGATGRIDVWSEAAGDGDDGDAAPAAVEFLGGVLEAPIARIGLARSSSGSVTMIGTAAVVDEVILGDDLPLNGSDGPGGTGSLLLSDGSTLRFSKAIRVGSEGGAGLLRLSGAGTVLDMDSFDPLGGDTLHIGAPAGGTGVGEVVVEDGARIASDKAIFGSLPQSGRLIVRGPGSIAQLGNAPQGAIDIRLESGGVVNARNLQLTPEDRMTWRVSGGSTGFFTNDGDWTLGGTARIELADGETIPAGTVIPIASTILVNGWFAAVELPDNDGVPLQLLLAGNALLLTAPNVVAIDITPSRVTLIEGYSAELLAQVVYQSGVQIPTTAANWSSADATIATVSASGVVAAVSPGSTSISATVGGLATSIPVTVLPFPDQGIDLMSVTADGVQANKSCAPTNTTVMTSGNGRFVGFATDSTTLDPLDTNGLLDVYRKDRWTGVIERISVSANGGASNGASVGIVFSHDGRYAAFLSSATNLLPGGTAPSGAQIYVRDTLTGVTTVVTGDLPGLGIASALSLPSISDDGRFVAARFRCLPLLPSFADSEARVSVGSAPLDIVLRVDRLTGETLPASVNAQGQPLPSGTNFGGVVISGDASAVLFLSSAPILPDSPSSLQAYLRRFPSGETIAASRSANGSYANDDLLSLQVDRTGRRVAFLSESTNLGTPLDAWRDFFIVDTLTGTIEIANTNANDEPANATIGSIAMSADGRFATFRSPATNLASPSSPSSVIYRKDLLTGEVITVSVGAIGTPNGGSVAGSAVSSDGGVVAFGSEASDLVPADFNDEVDVFARPMPASRAGDINGDAMIGAEDLAELLAAWGSSDYWADLDRDGAVGPSDLALLLGSWTPAADR